MALMVSGNGPTVLVRYRHCARPIQRGSCRLLAFIALQRFRPIAEALTLRWRGWHHRGPELTRVVQSGELVAKVVNRRCRFNRMGLQEHVRCIKRPYLAVRAQ